VMKLNLLAIFLALSAFSNLVYANDIRSAVAAYESGDYSTAFDKFSREAKKDVAIAQYYLGEMYSDGSGVPKSIEQAINWYKLAAEKGNIKAQYRLGFIYDKFDGKFKNNKQAIHWYTKAAQQGDDWAQNQLASMYWLKTEVEDYSKAIFWFEKSAEQGNIYSQQALGSMYRNGDGVLQDYVLSHMWYNIAVANGHPIAKGLRVSLEEMMTPSQIERAQHLASQCQKKKYKNCKK
jgi:TPR repeat protein